jgi:hypothetical protein
MGRSEADDRRLARWHQHRARGARPACRGRLWRPACDPLAREIGGTARPDLFGSAGRSQSFRAGSRTSRPETWGQRLCHGRAGARALCHRPRHAEGGHDFHAPVLRLRAGPRAHPHGDRRRNRAGHDRKHLSPQDRVMGPRDRHAEADPDHRRHRARGLRRARPCDGRRLTPVRDRGDGTRRPRADPLHLRHHG